MSGLKLKNVISINKQVTIITSAMQSQNKVLSLL